MNDDVTWWLYYRGEPIYAVRGDRRWSAQDARSAAVRWHDRVPLCYPYWAPFEFRYALLCSEVRTFPGEG